MGSRTLALVLVLCVSCSGPPHAPPRTSTPPPAVLALRTIDPADHDFADLRPLAPRLTGVRVVVLGEPRHADGAAMRARARLVAWLHEEQGFDVLAWEAGLWSASQMDAALHAPESMADVRPIGLPTLATTQAETRALFDYARGTSSTARPLHVLGIDINFNAPGALDRYRAWLAMQADEAHAWSPELRARIEAAFERFPKTSRFRLLEADLRDQDRAAFSALRAGFADAATPDRALVLQSLDDVDALYRWHEAVGADRSTTIPWDAHVALNNVRDEAMARNVMWLLAQDPSRRIVVWIANVHASRSLDGIDPTGSTISPSALGGYHPMGEHLARALGDALYVVGTTAYEGNVGAGAGIVAIGPAPDGSLEAVLARDGIERALVPLRGRPTETALFLGYEPVRAEWSRIYNAALFLRTMTPATDESTP